MNELFPIEQIWDNPGYAGTLENALNAAGIPTLTTEVGDARAFDRRIIPMFIEGTMNVLKLHRVIPGSMGRTAKEAGTFFGNALHILQSVFARFSTRNNFNMCQDRIASLNGIRAVLKRIICWRMRGC